MEENNVTMFMSADIKDLAVALCEFQASFEQPKLEKTVNVTTKTGGRYTFKYADLSACVRAAAPALKANGLLVTQIISNGMLVTLLIHKSGQWLKSELTLPQLGADYQAYGSAITYLKRYSYCALLGIVADTDDDANIAVGNQAEIRDSKSARNTASGDVAALVRQAIAEIKAVTTEADFQKIWNKWSRSVPSGPESEFYREASTKINQLKIKSA